MEFFDSFFHLFQKDLIFWYFLITLFLIFDLLQYTSFIVYLGEVKSSTCLISNQDIPL